MALGLATAVFVSWKLHWGSLSQDSASPHKPGPPHAADVQVCAGTENKKREMNLSSLSYHLFPDRIEK